MAERDPLDHDGDGRKGGSLPASQRGKDDLYTALDAAGIQYDKRWGRTRLEALLPTEAAPEAPELNEAPEVVVAPVQGPEPRQKASAGKLRVARENAIFDGEGGFYPVGYRFDAVDDETAAILIAQGLAE
jgi:hypothetical protein